jgi:4-diphosphocytidyl-2-C-methyl-D-erythritol kinase
MDKKSYAKVNIFLKIVGTRDNYHLLASRFVRVKNLYDIIKFQKGNFKEFTLEGNFGCKTQQNTIYKAYQKLANISEEVITFFTKHKVNVIKNIPEFAGLGGGSSNCATFMIMVNDVCNLQLSKDKLAEIGAEIGADVPFFIYEYDSANVTGVGEIVEKFEEEILNIETFTPKIECNTGMIFKEFRAKYLKDINKNSKIEIDKLLNMKSIDILNLLSIQDANDLYKPAINIYPNLEISNFSNDKGYFFSGSGSSFFKIIFSLDYHT